MDEDRGRTDGRVLLISLGDEAEARRIGVKDNPFCFEDVG